MTKLNAYLDNLTPNQWLYLASASALVADILIIVYAYNSMDTLLSKELVMKQLINAGYPPNTITQTDYEQFRAILVSTLKIGLNGFLVFHGIIYLCCAFAKNWAIKYVSFYAISTILLAIIAIILLPKGTISVLPLVFVALLIASHYGLRKFGNNKL